MIFVFRKTNRHKKAMERVCKCIERDIENLINDILNVIDEENVTSGGIIASIIDEVVNDYTSDNSLEKNNTIILCYYSSIDSAVRELGCDDEDEFDSKEEFYARVASYVIDFKMSENPKMSQYYLSP